MKKGIESTVQFATVDPKQPLEELGHHFYSFLLPSEVYGSSESFKGRLHFYYASNRTFMVNFKKFCVLNFKRNRTHETNQQFVNVFMLCQKIKFKKIGGNVMGSKGPVAAKRASPPSHSFVTSLYSGRHVTSLLLIKKN